MAPCSRLVGVVLRGCGWKALGGLAARPGAIWSVLRAAAYALAFAWNG